jgi:hypothetical protein
MKIDKPSRSIAFAPEEEIIFPDFLQKKIPRTNISGIFGAIWYLGLNIVIIVLIPALLIKFLHFCSAFDNPFELAFAIFDIIILYFYMRYAVYDSLKHDWFYRYGIIAIATVTKLKTEGVSMNTDCYYTFYSYKTSGGREFEGFLICTQNIYEYLEVGDRIIILYNRRFPRWHIEYDI